MLNGRIDRMIHLVAHVVHPLIGAELRVAVDDIVVDRFVDGRLAGLDHRLLEGRILRPHGVDEVVECFLRVRRFVEQADAVPPEGRTRRWAGRRVVGTGEVVTFSVPKANWPHTPRELCACTEATLPA